MFLQKGGKKLSKYIGSAPRQIIFVTMALKVLNIFLVVTFCGAFTSQGKKIKIIQVIHVNLHNMNGIEGCLVLFTLKNKFLQLSQILESTLKFIWKRRNFECFYFQSFERVSLI